MKFLTKDKKSEIISKGITYKVGQSKNNEVLRNMLLHEQKNFCAYSEKFIEELDSVEVEHLNPSKKGNDDYFNYYAVVRDCNLYNKKSYPVYKDASFFKTLFFQDSGEFNKRVEYRDGQYQEIKEDDAEAMQLIAFLGFNRQGLFRQRENHIKRLKETFETGKYTDAQKLEHFRTHKQDLDFITAIEIELGLNLSEFYN